MTISQWSGSEKIWGFKIIINRGNYTSISRSYFYSTHATTRKTNGTKKKNWGKYAQRFKDRDQKFCKTILEKICTIQRQGMRNFAGKKMHNEVVNPCPPEPKLGAQPIMLQSTHF